MITAVAVRELDGTVWSAPKPARHSWLRDFFDNYDRWRVVTQGFIDDHGRFLDRLEAHKVALATGQVEETITGTMLYSEDLW